MATISVLSANTVPAFPFGRKASRLSELLRAGYPVIDGFVISSDEHLRHLSGAGLDTTASSEAVRRSSLSSGLEHELFTRVSGTGNLFAVRSSALAEDDDHHSRAGLYRTVLNVTPAGLPAAVLDVWASAHQGTQGTESGQCHFSPMAVLIQPMLAGNAFGVVSSADPVTGSPGAVVEVGAEPFAVTSGQRRVAAFRVDHSQTVTPAPGNEPSVSTDVLRTAASLARDVRDFYGQDVELEFGCQGDATFILQVRPVVIDPGARQIVRDSIRGTWVLDPVHYPRPLTPLFESIFAPLVQAASSAVFTQYGVLIRRIDLRTIDGWPYVRAVPLTGHAAPGLPGPLIGLIVRVHPMLRERTRASTAACAVDLMSQHAENWKATVRPGAIAFIESVGNTDLTSVGRSALTQYLHDALSQLKKVVYSNFQTDFAYLIPLADFADHMRQKYGWSDQRSLQVVHGDADLDGSYAAALKSLAARLSSHPDLAEKWQSTRGGAIAPLLGDDAASQAWHAHTRRWGLLLLGYDLDEPTVRELPDMERNALLALADRQRVAPADGPSGPPDTLTAEESEMLARARERYPLREDGESVKATLLGVVRAVATELGRRLKAAGQLRRANLVLYLTISELFDVFAGNGTVPDQVIEFRVQARENATGRVPRPELGRKASRDPDLHWLPAPSRRVHRAVTLLARNEILSGLRSDRDQLVGRPASPGIHSGKVRVITEPGQLQHLMPGDVIVAPTASSAWSSAFLTAGALVTEAGGLLSHAAIVARELNLPAVVGVDHATARLQTGDWITVDGNNGTVDRQKTTQVT